MGNLEHQDHSSLVELVAVIQYRHLAFRDNLPHSLFLLCLAMILLVLVWFWTEHLLFIVLFSTLVFWSLRSLFFPVTCIFSSDGIQTISLGHSRLFSWGDIHFFKMTPYGVQLRVTSAWYPLQVFRTPFIPVPPAFRSDVTAIMREMIPGKELF